MSEHIRKAAKLKAVDSLKLDILLLSEHIIAPVNIPHVMANTVAVP